ncbi:MAG: DNA replication and repair protein RecF [Candidatus Marinimicrobia bacterium]|nr:DNA replication and repair protein RecF [Candidatus Neomarinimicrobiota bacterium]MBT3631201.1 DNA replication and repair protein RecF [Candidatus Neomarinimicrobiota bacterium]MBT3824709.1 DNA replication and repair protein RecF [Candidatus Neomarinimicrobiota bacterium]MBT4296102.1 DNA replication and repair protein RecF [Candidatus Neomarinimicrobiota bacterium]MBT4418777.1 DNA replication and repair protein RecF [Candidatus Neomarinimicrobiota bacterium]
MIGFRKYEQVSMEFGAFTNILHGENGAGKTTILEAIHSLAYTRSFKTRLDADLAQHGKVGYQLKGVFKDHHENDHEVRLKVESSRKKLVSVNDKNLSSRAQIIGRFPLVSLTPEDSDLTFGSPEIRRLFFNKLLSQVDSGYLENLQTYARILKQRNALLQSYANDGTPIDRIQMSTLDDQRAKISAQLHAARSKHIAEFKKLLYAAYAELEDENSLKMAFISNVRSTAGELEGLYRNAYQDSLADDMRKGTTTRGPHRDMFTFYLNTKDLRKFGSQGEHKLVLVAIKFAEGRFLETFLDEPPVFLLDDLFAELDVKRSTMIVESLRSGHQIFITATDLADLRHHGLELEGDTLQIIDAGMIQAHG